MAALNNDGYLAWLEAKMRDKDRLPPGAYNAIKQWLSSGEERYISHATFRYIAQYMRRDINQNAERLRVACADHGYTLVELDALMAAGKTAVDVAKEVLARGVDESD